MAKKIALNKKIGQRIRKLRDYQGYSQDYVADEIGMSSGNFGKIERAEVDPNTVTLYKIARILKVNVTDFFEDIDLVAEPTEKTGFITREEFFRTNQETINILKNELAKFREEFALRTDNYQLKRRVPKPAKKK